MFVILMKVRRTTQGPTVLCRPEGGRTRRPAPILTGSLFRTLWLSMAIDMTDCLGPWDARNGILGTALETAMAESCSPRSLDMCHVSEPAEWVRAIRSDASNDFGGLGGTYEGTS